LQFQPPVANFSPNQQLNHSPNSRVVKTGIFQTPTIPQWTNEPANHWTKTWVFMGIFKNTLLHRNAIATFHTI